MNQTTAGLFTKNLYESNTQEEWDNFIGIFNYHYHFGFPGPSKIFLKILFIITSFLI